MLTIALLLSACGKQETMAPEPAEPPADSQPAEEPQPEPAPYVPAGTNPLTGLPMEPELENNRPVAVMLNNLKAAQPQLGTTQADIIYEVPAEGGITRMLGVYQSLDGVETIGSIRSARPYYMELALGHDAVYVHAGGSPEAYQKLKEWKMDHIDGVNGGASQEDVFWRDAQRRKTMGYEHSLLTSGERISGYLSTVRYSTLHKEDYRYPQAFAADAEVKDGTPAEHLKLLYTSYKTGLFDYDAEQGAYRISQYGSPYVDGNTGEQVCAVNVLLLETDISRIPGDSEGRLKVRTTGEGSGTLLLGGKSTAIRWSRADRTSPFVYTTEDGQTLTLRCGNSYVCLLDPDDSTLEIS